MVSMIKYFLKAFFSVFVPFVVMTALLLLVNYRLSVRNAESLYRDILKTYWTIASEYDFSDSESVNTLFRDLSRERDLRMTLIGLDGTVLADSSLDRSAIGSVENHKYREEIRKALSGKSFYAVRKSEITGKYSIYYAAPLNSGPVLRVASDGDLFLSIYEKIRLNAIAVFSVFTGLIFFLSLYLTYKEVKPKVQLSSVEKAIRRNSDDFVLPEIAEPLMNSAASLMYHINRSRLREKRIREREAATLKKIINHIDECVILTDENGNVLESNRCASDFFGADVEKGACPSRSGQNCETAAFFQEIFAREEPLFRLAYGKRLFEVYTRTIDSNRLVVLHDISARADYEDYKAELTANIAHELKTPLAVIMGTAETLNNDPQMDGEWRERFLEKIYRSSVRLNRFVNQTLELYRIENTGLTVEEPTCVAEMIERMVFPPSEKKICFSNRTERPFAIDIVHTETVLGNLINNALKYSDGGEVRVFIGEENGALVLEVADNGPPISEKERKRIFERFYTVSKSRQKSGFGLGLSIVKHIAHLYNGEASVFENEQGGNTFRVLLREKKEKKEKDHEN